MSVTSLECLESAAGVSDGVGLQLVDLTDQITELTASKPDAGHFGGNTSPSTAMTELFSPGGDVLVHADRHAPSEVGEIRPSGATNRFVEEHKVITGVATGFVAALALAAADMLAADQASATDSFAFRNTVSADHSNLDCDYVFNTMIPQGIPVGDNIYPDCHVPRPSSGGDSTPNSTPASQGSSDCEAERAAAGETVQRRELKVIEKACDGSALDNANILAGRGQLPTGSAWKYARKGGESSVSSSSGSPNDGGSRVIVTGPNTGGVVSQAGQRLSSQPSNSDLAFQDNPWLGWEICSYNVRDNDSVQNCSDQSTPSVSIRRGVDRTGFDRHVDPETLVFVNGGDGPLILTGDSGEPCIWVNRSNKRGETIRSSTGVGPYEIDDPRTLTIGYREGDGCNGGLKVRLLDEETRGWLWGPNYGLATLENPTG